MTLQNAPHLRSFFARHQRIQGDIDDLNEDKKQLIAELKAHGYDARAFKAAVKRLRDEDKSPDGLREQDELLNLYLRAIKGEDEKPATGTPVATRAPARETEALRKPSSIPATTTRSVETPHDPASGEILDEVAGTDPAEQKEDISGEPAGSEEIDISIPQFLRRDSVNKGDSA
jgi:uncharacterized protein (UPF0335 family)